MSISADEVRHVALLARLEVTDDEVEAMATQLSGVLEYINQLNELDTEGVTPTSHSIDMGNVFREDEVIHRFNADSWKTNAPSEDHGHFRVPRVIEE